MTDITPLAIITELKQVFNSIKTSCLAHDNQKIPKEKEPPTQQNQTEKLSKPVHEPTGEPIGAEHYRQGGDKHSMSNGQVFNMVNIPEKEKSTTIMKSNELDQSNQPPHCAI